MLGGPAQPDGSVLGARPRRGLAASDVTTVEGSNVTHAATTLEGSDVTHEPRNYNLRPRKVRLQKS